MISVSMQTRNFLRSCFIVPGTFPISVSAFVDELPKGSHETAVQRFHTQDNVQILGGAKTETRFSHCQGTGCASDQHIPIAILGKMSTKNIEANYQAKLFIISSRAPSIRSSLSSFSDRYRDKRSTVLSPAHRPGS
jgi:hypothetical protein